MKLHISDTGSKETGNYDNHRRLVNGTDNFWYEFTQFPRVVRSPFSSEQRANAPIGQ